jgi:hypothetical protein
MSVNKGETLKLTYSAHAQLEIQSQHHSQLNHHYEVLQYAIGTHLDKPAAEILLTATIIIRDWYAK